MPSNTLNTITLNCRGLSGYRKRNKLFALLNLRDYDVICLQETHVGDDMERELFKKQWSGPSYWSVGSRTTAGVGILVNQRLDYVFKHIAYDTHMRTITLDCEVASQPITIINVYCPNKDRERNDFLEQLNDKVTSNKNYIIPGDFNCVEDVELYKRGGVDHNYSKDQLNDLRAIGCLTDAFRFAHPGVRSYTFHDVIHDVSTRIDRVYVSDRFQHNIISSEHVDCVYADHYGVNVQLNINNNRQGRQRILEV